MRILFLYSDYSHAEPLLRIRELLCEHGILLESHQCQHAAQAAALLAHKADAVVVHHQLMGEDVLCDGRPVAILERIDGAQLESRAWLPDVAMVLKSYVFRDRAMNNQFKGRASAHRLKAAGLVSVENTRALPGLPAQLSDADLAKIHVVYGFGASARIKRLAPQFVDLDAPRRFYLQFRGYVSYKGTEIELHRQAAATAAHAAFGMWPAEVCCGDTVPYEEYCREMFLSHAVLSPWGWGEPCYRDFEAALLGAVLIKPNTDYVESWPDFYRSGETYVPCALDFQDVTGLVQLIVNDWQAYRGMRERARTLALEATDDPALAAHMVKLFRKLTVTTR